MNCDGRVDEYTAQASSGTSSYTLETTPSSLTSSNSRSKEHHRWPGPTLYIWTAQASVMDWVACWWYLKIRSTPYEQVRLQWWTDWMVFLGQSHRWAVTDGSLTMRMIEILLLAGGCRSPSNSMPCGNRTISGDPSPTSSAFFWGTHCYRKLSCL